jgi:transposase-like protein
MAKIGLKNEKIKILNELVKNDWQTKLALLKNYQEMSLLLINQLLEDEVRQYSGERYSREKPHEGQYSRWGTNPGSVWIGEEKVNIDVPRIYDKVSGSNKSLESYESLKEIEPDERRMLKAMLCGLSTNDYKSVVQQFVDSRGLSRSKVSQRFIEESSKQLEEFNNRDLSTNNFIAIFLDGKYFYKENMVIAIGINDEGIKIPLGFIQMARENAISIDQLLSNLIERGLRFEEGILLVVDGSKALFKAIKDTFGDYAVIQRCQWHKRENILSYLSEKNKDIFKKKINKAYRTESYEGARNQLMSIYNELLHINKSAAQSVLEGLEETLTIHRLGLYEQFNKSFCTTNVIENVNSQLRKYTSKVKCWKTSDQRHRWIAAGLLEGEQKMNKVINHRNLDILKVAIKKEVERVMSKE